MDLKLSVPSKTFLIGEYVALVGGPSLIAATDKRFEIAVKLRGRGRLNGVHEDSPAGKYYKQHRYAYLDVDIDFVDPYDGAGGLGASSAQFVLLYALKAFIETGFDKVSPELNPQKVWNAFRDLHSGQDGWMPSGSDVVAQLVGGLSQIQTSPFRIEQFDWPFENLSFMIFKTPHKVSTHEHLKSLKNFNAEPLQKLSTQIISSVRESDALQFIQGVQRFEGLLRESKFVCIETYKILESFKNMKSVLAVKGCGALGADTIVVIAEREQVEPLKNLSKVVGLKLIATDKDLSSGLKVEFDYKFSKRDLYGQKGDKPYEVEL